MLVSANETHRRVNVVEKTLRSSLACQISPRRRWPGILGDATHVYDVGFAGSISLPVFNLQTVSKQSFLQCPCAFEVWHQWTTKTTPGVWDRNVPLRVFWFDLGRGLRVLLSSLLKSHAAPPPVSIPTEPRQPKVNRFLTKPGLGGKGQRISEDWN